MVILFIIYGFVLWMIFEAIDRPIFRDPNQWVGPFKMQWNNLGLWIMWILPFLYCGWQINTANPASIVVTLLLFIIWGLVLGMIIFPRGDELPKKQPINSIWFWWILLLLYCGWLFDKCVTADWDSHAPFEEYDEPYYGPW